MSSMAGKSCPTCESAASTYIRKLNDHYRLFACNKCGVKFCDPFASAPADFYENAKDLASRSRHSGPTDWYAGHPSRLSQLFKNCEGKVLLDVGCGNGAFAEFAASAGYKVIGLDRDSVSIEIARSRNIPDAEFHCASLEQFCASASRAGAFDVVTMFEVFEHLECPSDTLKLIKQCLRAGGVFAGSLPNTRRLFMWQFHMNYEMPPYHLTYWTEKSWSQFLERFSGFLMKHTEATIYYGYVSDVLMYRFQLPRIIRSIIMRLLYPVEYKIEKRYKLGASFYFEAVRN